MKSYAWMKLQLDPAEATKYDDPSLADSEGSGVLARPINKSAVDICADYLTEVAKFAYQSLARRISVEVLEATPIEFWFTVPAVWTDRAKADTMRAARKAAVQARLHFHEDTQVSLIREPEAAAVATISYLTQGGSEQQIKVGDSILICDCGGGTVDITTYEISNVMPKLTFKELLVGTGITVYLFVPRMIADLTQVASAAPRTSTVSSFAGWNPSSAPPTPTSAGRSVVQLAAS